MISEVQLKGYDARSIRVLSGLEAVRHRPAMYIGSTGPQGLLQLVTEVVQNSLDEAMVGPCQHIEVTLAADGTITVEDDGRGIPVEVHPDAGISSLELVMTTLHSGGKFERNGSYPVAGGLHGVGISCVNGLSEHLKVDVWREGLHHQQSYTRGQPDAPIVQLGNTDRTGTRIQYLADSTIFDSIKVDVAALEERLVEQSFLHPALTIVLHRPDGTTSTFHDETGLVGLTRRMAGRTALHDEPISIEARSGDATVRAALCWTHTFHNDVRSYVNGIRTLHGGTHVEGLLAAVTRTIRSRARQMGLTHTDEIAIAENDASEGLVCAHTLMLPQPQFEGQTKTLLTSGHAKGIVQQAVEEGLNAWMDAHPEVATAIVGKALEATRARAAARRASERARYQVVDTRVSKDVYRQQFGIRSKTWHDSARWITDKELLGAHADMCKMPSDCKVLDVCCGSGVVGNSFRGRVGSIQGLDLTPEMRALAQTRLDEVTLGDVYEIPFDEGSFDLVCNREVLHLLPRPERPLAQIFRVLRPGGQFIFGQLVPYGPEDAPWFFRIVKKKQPLFFNNFMPEDLVRLLTDAGFVDIETKELQVWEDIDTWIETWETPSLQRHEIRRLYHEAPAEVRRVHPFEISADGRIMDLWRWVIFSARKPE